MSKENMIAIPAEPDDPEDRPISVAGLERARMGRRLRILRHHLGLSQQEFANAFAIPVANLRQYEMARHMPPPAVRAYLKIIEAQPAMVREVLAENLEPIV